MTRLFEVTVYSDGLDIGLEIDGGTFETDRIEFHTFGDWFD